MWKDQSHLNSKNPCCSRAVPSDVIHKYHMEYHSMTGISLQVEHETFASPLLRVATTAIKSKRVIMETRIVWVGWNFLGIDGMDVDGTAYVNGS